MILITIVLLFRTMTAMTTVRNNNNLLCLPYKFIQYNANEIVVLIRQKRKDYLLIEPYIVPTHLKTCELFFWFVKKKYSRPSPVIPTVF